MPELPEVETVRTILEEKMVGKKITNVEIRYSGIIKEDPQAFKSALENQTILKIQRRGKFLIFVFKELYLLCHLRMEGKFYIKDQLLPYEKHEHVIFHLDNGEDLRYHDTRKFGIMMLKHADLYQTPPLALLAPEPFSEAMNVDFLKEKLKKLKKPIKEALLDQSIFCGLGNIYVDEVLFASKINPQRSSYLCNQDEIQSIIMNARRILSLAIQSGGTTIRSYTSSLGVTGRFQVNLMVHTKEGFNCPNCQTIIIKIRVGGRGTYLCPTCQKN